MYIVAERSADPLSPAAGDSPPILATSHAYDILYSELERYTLGTITGRSVLISGHRGSGKTTLVYHAIQNLRREFRDEHRPRRPLLVRLHGPDLLPSSEPEQPPEAPPAAGAAPPSNPESTASPDTTATPPTPSDSGRHDSLSPPQRVLIQTTTALYRALAVETAQAFRERALAQTPHRPDVGELAAQLSLELDDAPAVGVLRALWRQAGVLGSGVLFAKSPRPDQGVREIVALSTAAQAFRIVSGNYEQKEQSKDEDTKKDERSIGSEIKVKDIVTPLFGLLTGGVVGTGLLTGDAATSAGAGLAALVAAVVTTVTLNVASSRSRTRSAVKEQTFIRDRTVATLDRELPVLMQRVHDAGLAPVFVVDELDKVDDLQARMRDLVGHLKHFVTERAFFCFLTNRDYFEYLADLSRANPYPPEHTYFPHRLFVSYRPEHLHEYLDELLPENRTSDAQPFERVLLFYRLLHKSRLHVFDLKGELSKISDYQGNVAIPLERLTSLGYFFHIMIEMAVELQLGDHELRDRLDQDPYFGQLAYDTLYYASRMWADGEPVLDVSEEAMRAYLRNRIAQDRASAHSQPVSAEGGSPVADFPLSELDFKFLYGRLHDLVSLLLEPRRLLERVQNAGPPINQYASWWPSVVGAIPRNERRPADHAEMTASAYRVDYRLLEPESADNATQDAGGKFRWRYDVFGRSLARIELNPDTFETLRAFILRLNGFCRKLTGGRMGLQQLAADVGIISQTPPWSVVNTALERLAYFVESEEDYSEREEDQIAVDSYCTMLENHGVALGLGFVRAADVGRASSKEARDEQMMAGLMSLATVLNLETKNPTEVEESLMAIGGGVDESLPEQLRLRRNGLLDWVKAVRQAMREVRYAHSDA